MDAGISTHGEGPTGGHDPAAHRDGPDGAPVRGRDELPYKVEVWDATASAPERTIALTRTPGLGYAALYAAAREHPARDITLTGNGVTLSHWRARPN